jgi:hypothetical protein
MSVFCILKCLFYCFAVEDKSLVRSSSPLIYCMTCETLEEDLVYLVVDCASQKYSMLFFEDSLVP